MRITTWDKNAKINDFIIYEYKYEKYQNRITREKDACLVYCWKITYIIQFHIITYSHIHMYINMSI